MKKNNYKKLYFIPILLLFSGCGDGFKNFRDAITGQKVQTTDEFLIKKKDPLILPPKYEELPLPSRQKTASEPDSKSSVESILSKSEGVKTDNRSISNLEKEILENLKNNN